MFPRFFALFSVTSAQSAFSFDYENFYRKNFVNDHADLKKRQRNLFGR